MSANKYCAFWFSGMVLSKYLVQVNLTYNIKNKLKYTDTLTAVHMKQTHDQYINGACVLSHKSNLIAMNKLVTVVAMETQ